MSASDTNYKARFPRTYEASFVAQSMVDGRELWCVGRDVCADLEGQHAALLSQVARLRDSLKQSEQAMSQLLSAAVMAPKAVCDFPPFKLGINMTDEALARSRALLAEMEQP